MKKLPTVPLAWGGALLIFLLVALAVAVLLAGREIERQARLIEIDAVPGLIDGHTIRSAYSEGFVSMIQAVGADTPAQREAAYRRMTDLDAMARAAGDDYTSTIHIDPVTDSANFREVIKARDAFLATRTRFIEGARNWSPTETQQFFVRELTPVFDALMQACDVLVAYNNRSGTLFSKSAVVAVARLRWTVIGIVVLAVACTVVMGVIVVRRVRMEGELRESERKFATAFNVSPHAMSISRRRDGRILAANEAFLRHFGLQDQKVVGRSVFELGVWKAPADRERLLGALDRDGRLRDFMWESVGADGWKTTVLISVEPVTVEAEPCLLAVAHDITERVNAELALAVSLAEFRAIFDGAAINMVTVDTAGRVLRWNPAFEQFLGYGGGELEQMKFADFTYPDDVAADLTLFQQLVSGERNFYHLEKRFVRKDGATVWGRLTTSVVRDATGKLVQAVGMIEDISERKRAEMALRDSETARQKLQEQLIVAQRLEAIGQLAGGVAHDFNNMLAAIMLYLDLLKLDPTLSPAAIDSLRELTTATKRAAGLTRQLLLFSRREPAQRQVVDLKVVVNNLLKMLERLVGDHLELVHTGAPHPLRVHADPGMLEQVVMNLVVNARDAMPRGGMITLRTEAIEVGEAQAGRHPAGRVGRFVRLMVVDTGCGMSAETQAHIFEPFFTTKEAGKGTGLGLATVFGIAQQHDGWIEVESAEGRGSSFAVYLPAHAGAAAETPLSAPAAPVLHGRETILLAEDNEPVRLVTARILRQKGYSVLEAGNSQEASALLTTRAGEVDLLLTDVVMPGGLMGHELAAGLPKGKRAPKVILMSGHNTLIERGTSEGVAQAYLSKPFDTDRLLRVVRTTLDGTDSPV